MTKAEFVGTPSKEELKFKRAADRLFAVAKAKGYVEGEGETPRLNRPEVRKALKGTGLTELDFKTGLNGYATLRDGTGIYSGQLLLSRSQSPRESGHATEVYNAIKSGLIESHPDYPDLRPSPGTVGEQRYYTRQAPDAAERILFPQPNQNRPQTYVANTPDLALGQGENADGVLIEYKPTLKVAQDSRKPSAGFVESQGMAEFISTDPNESTQVQRITVPASVLGQAPFGTRWRNVLMPRLRKQGWQVSRGENGAMVLDSPGTVGQGATTASPAKVEGESSATATPSPAAPLAGAPSGDTKSSSAVPAQQSTVAAPFPQSTPRGATSKQPWEMTRAEFVPTEAPYNESSYGYFRAVRDAKPFNADEVAKQFGDKQAAWQEMQRSIDRGNVEESLKSRFRAVQRSLEKQSNGLRTPNTHRRAVAEAITSGQPVPAAVLADYPDLQKGALQSTAEGRQGASKQPWEMTLAEYDQHNLERDIKMETSSLDPANAPSPEAYDAGLKRLEDRLRRDHKMSDDDRRVHRKYVMAALRSGKTVPPSVLADYPDLAQPPPPADTPAVASPKRTGSELPPRTDIYAGRSTADRWNTAKLGTRLKWANDWRTNKGKLSRLGEKIVESNWSDLSVAAQRAIEQKIALDYPSATPAPSAPESKTATASEKKSKPRPTDRQGVVRFGGPAGPTVQQGQNLSLTLESRWDAIRRKVQDEFLPVQRMQEDIARQGGKIGEQSEPYLATELFQGRAGDQLRALETEYIQPAITRMRKAGLTVADLDKYLIALHAPERNAHVAKINPKMPDGGSGMTNAEAAKVVADVARSGKKADYDYIANSIHAMNEQTRKLQLDSGLISREQYDAWGKYQKYVPLRTDMEGEGMRTGQGFNIRGAESKRATGRSSEADSPLTFSLMQAQEKIIRAEKNRVGQAMLKLVEDNPDPDLWKINDTPTMQSVNTGTGLVQTTPDPMYQYADNVLAVKRDGKTHLIEFKGEQGKKIAAAMKRLNAAKFNIIVRGVQKTLNVYKALQTSYNPDFVLPNLVRDLQTAGINLGADKSAKMAVGMVKGVPKAWKAAFDVTGNKAAKVGSKYHDAMREYLANGGKVDSYATDDFSETQKQLEKQLEEADPSGITRARIILRAGAQAIDRVNGATETAVRLSAYVQARDAGMSPARAASLAKNLTVNFNRKGEWGSVINTMYVFSNASIQGSTRLLKSLTTTKRGAAVAGGIVASGIAYGLAAAALFGEDEDGRKIWDTIPAHEKENHILIPTGGKKYIKIPLPYGYNVLFNAGRATGEVTAGSKKPGAAAFEVLQAASGAFNPLGGDGSALQMLIPTIGDPFVQAAENKSWTGKPIVPEQAPFGLQKPQSELSTRRTSNTAKAVARWINKATGGDEVTSGKIDVSPALLDHFFEFAVGGTGRFVERAAQLPGKDEIKTRDIPVIRRFVGDNLEDLNLGEFYRTAKTIEDAYARTKHYLKSGDKERAQSYYKANKVEFEMRKYIGEVRDKLKELREIEDKAVKLDRPDVAKKARDRMEVEARKFMTVFRRKGGSVPADPG